MPGRLRAGASSASSPASSPRARLTDREKRIVAYHEAGHALCGELLPGVDRPHKVSIVPRGSALGFAMSLPEEDRYLKTREDLIDYMTVCLGGRVAEQIVFGAVTTGAANDLQKVAEITHAMVHQYAMAAAAAGQRALLDPQGASEISRRIHDEEQRELAFEAESHRPRDPHRATATSSTSSPRPCSSTRSSTAPTSTASSRDVPHVERRPGVTLRIAAADPGVPPGPTS